MGIVGRKGEKKNLTLDHRDKYAKEREKLRQETKKGDLEVT